MVASLKEEKSTLAFVVTEKIKQTLIIIVCRDADVDGFPIISSISLQPHGEYFCQVYNSC